MLVKDAILKSEQLAGGVGHCEHFNFGIRFDKCKPIYGIIMIFYQQLYIVDIIISQHDWYTYKNNKNYSQK